MACSHFFCIKFRPNFHVLCNHKSILNDVIWFIIECQLDGRIEDGLTKLSPLCLPKCDCIPMYTPCLISGRA